MVFNFGCSNHPFEGVYTNYKFLIFFECFNISYKILIGGCSSIGRATVCGTVSSLFKSGYPPYSQYSLIG